MKKAIIFDLDGTLWDATGCSVDIWNRVFDKHKKTSMRMTQEISSSLMGKTMPEIGAALFPNMTEEERMSIVNDFGDEEVKYLAEHGANVFDGVEDCSGGVVPGGRVEGYVHSCHDMAVAVHENATPIEISSPK